MNKIRIAVTLCLLLLSAVPSRISAFPATLPAPTVTGVSPTQAYNYQATTITISGSNFVATPTVLLGNVSLTNVTFVNSTTLTATVPADLPGGTYTITVTNPDSQSTGVASAFTVSFGTDGTLGVWKSTASMSVRRYIFAAVYANGYIYALGGHIGGSGSEASVEASGD